MLDWTAWNTFLHLTLFWHSVFIPARNNKTVYFSFHISLNVSENIKDYINKNRTKTRSVFQNRSNISLTKGILLIYDDKSCMLCQAFWIGSDWGYSKNPGLDNIKETYNEHHDDAVVFSLFASCPVSWWIHRRSAKDILRKGKNVSLKNGENYVRTCYSWDQTIPTARRSQGKKTLRIFRHRRNVSWIVFLKYVTSISNIIHFHESRLILKWRACLRVESKTSSHEWRLPILDGKPTAPNLGKNSFPICSIITARFSIKNLTIIPKCLNFT